MRTKEVDDEFVDMFGDEFVAGAGASDDVAVLEQLLEIEPGAQAIMFLSQMNPAELNEAGQVMLLQLWRRQQNWLAEKVLSSTAVLAGPTPSAAEGDRAPDADDWAIDLVGATLGMTTGSARNRVKDARSLLEQLPACRLAVAAGHLSDYHARIITEAVEGLTAAAVAQVDAQVAAKIPAQGWAAFRRTLKRAVLRARPDEALAAHDQVVGWRGVSREWFPDRMGGIEARLSPTDTQTVWDGLNASARLLQAAARAAGEADCGIDAYRADALVAWANAALANPNAPTSHGRRPQIQVVIDLATLFGLADNPGELLGYGPIASQVAQQLAADGEWRRLVVEPVTGHLLDYGTTVYRPPQQLQDFLVSRDRHCRFPGCFRRPSHCDIDHNIPYPVGATASANCCCLCRRHHRLKTFGGWTVKLHDDGSCSWTAPNGRVFLVASPAQLE
jgi:hypothetical protein